MVAALPRFSFQTTAVRMAEVDNSVEGSRRTKAKPNAVTAEPPSAKVAAVISLAVQDMLARWVTERTVKQAKSWTAGANR
jgi:hypothetical protein